MIPIDAWLNPSPLPLAGLFARPSDFAVRPMGALGSSRGAYAGAQAQGQAEAPREKARLESEYRGLASVLQQLQEVSRSLAADATGVSSPEVFAAVEEVKALVDEATALKAEAQAPYDMQEPWWSARRNAWDPNLNPDFSTPGRRTIESASLNPWNRWQAYLAAADDVAKIGDTLDQILQRARQIRSQAAGTITSARAEAERRLTEQNRLQAQEEYERRLVETARQAEEDRLQRQYDQEEQARQRQLDLEESRFQAEQNRLLRQQELELQAAQRQQQQEEARYQAELQRQQQQDAYEQQRLAYQQQADQLSLQAELAAQYPQQQQQAYGQQSPYGLTPYGTPASYGTPYADPYASLFAQQTYPNQVSLVPGGAPGATPTWGLPDTSLSYGQFPQAQHQAGQFVPGRESFGSLEPDDYSRARTPAEARAAIDRMNATEAARNVVSSVGDGGGILDSILGGVSSIAEALAPAVSQVASNLLPGGQPAYAPPPPPRESLLLPALALGAAGYAGYKLFLAD